jgi:hypothetical protein
MAKEKFDVANITGQKVTKTEELGNGFVRIIFGDGNAIVAQVVPLALKVVSEKEPAKEEAPKDKKSKKAAKEEEEEEEDPEEEEEEEITLDEIREALIESGMDKKKVKKMSDEELEEAYENLEEEEDEDPEEEEEEEDDKLTASDILESDFDDLEDIIDDQELDIDLEDYDPKKPKDLDKLRKEVAKALKIKL